MAYVTVHVDPEDVLDDLSDREIRDILRDREAKAAAKKGQQPAESSDARRARLLEDIYRYFRNRCPCEALREFLHDETGKIL